MSDTDNLSKVPPIPITKDTSPELIRVMAMSGKQAGNPFATAGKGEDLNAQPEATPQAETPLPVSVSPVPVQPAPSVQSFTTGTAPMANPFAAAGGKGPDDDKKSKIDPESYLFDYVNELELFISHAGEPTATIKQNNIVLNVAVSSQEFKDHLLHYVVTRFKSIPERKVITDAVHLAESLARVSMKKIELHHRVLFDGNQLVFDLIRDDGIFVVADNNGWILTQNVNYKFVRYPHSSPLPLPDINGNVLELLPFLNIEDENDKILVVCWLVAAFITTIPRAILCLHGSAGSAKTTQATILKSLVDPSYEGGLYIRNKEDEMALLLAQSAMPFFDNLTKITKAIENMLCMAATGGGYITQSVKYLTKRPWHRRRISLQNTSSPCADDAADCAGSLSAFPSALACLWPFHRGKYCA